MKKILFFVLNIICVICVIVANKMIFKYSSMYERVSLDLSFVSIIASINIAIIIYLLETAKEEKKENDEIERAKSEMIYNIEMSFRYAVFFTSDTLDNWPSKDIENVFARNQYVLHKCLSNEEFKLLQKFIECIVDARDFDNRVGFSDFLKEYLRPIFLSKNPSLVYCSENYDCFRVDIIDLLNKLKNEDCYNPEANYIIHSDDGSTTIENLGDNKVRILRDDSLLVEGRYQFNAKGEVYFEEGYSVLANPYYKGYYKNAKFDGFGVYDNNCIMFGIWAENELIDGIQKNVLIKYCPKVTCDFNQYQLQHIEMNKLNEIVIVSEFIDNVEELKEYTSNCNDLFYVVDLLYENQDKYINDSFTVEEFEALLRSLNKISAAKG